MNRKDFLKLTTSLGLATWLTPSALAHDPRSTSAQDSGPTPAQALKLLKEGNLRYINDTNTDGTGQGAKRRAEVARGQRPHSIILSCSDSRVIPEVFFDTGLGELFVVRVAGNIVSGSNYGIIGSCEYGAAVLSCPLLMVIGHENCGGVKSAIETIERKTTLPGSIEDLVEAIRPAVESSKAQPGNALENAIKENVRHSMRRLTTMSSLLDEKVKTGKLMIVGGVYDLDSGVVTFL